MLAKKAGFGLLTGHQYLDGIVLSFLKLSGTGAQINRAAPNGMTPLMVAARLGHADAVCVLIDAGADKEIVDDKNGMPALHWAAFRGHLEVVMVLLHVNADPTFNSPCGTVIELATASGHTHVVAHVTRHLR